eukprot:GILK01003190.1.p1 GENE.GILK01003190.1~~GILK01003190.1.p1  ORF type:complete len:230 (+),score=38.27 GILK01003190.1:50-739(+)
MALVDLYSDIDAANTARLQKDVHQAVPNMEKELALMQKCLRDNSERWPYLVEYEWLFVEGRGDLVVSNLRNEIAVIEVKYLDIVAHGKNACVKRNKKLKKVKTQAIKAYNAFLNLQKHSELRLLPGMKILIFTYTNVVGLSRIDSNGQFMDPSLEVSQEESEEEYEEEVQSYQPKSSSATGSSTGSGSSWLGWGLGLLATAATVAAVAGSVVAAQESKRRRSNSSDDEN